MTAPHTAALDAPADAPEQPAVEQPVVEHSAQRPATRRRGETLQQAIFEAAREQLGALGWAKLTMEGIAEAAGTGKAALYRRWSNKEDLVFAALTDALPDPDQVPEYDTLREDLLALLDCYRRLYTLSHGAAFQVFKRDVLPDNDRLKAMLRALVTGPLRLKLQQALTRGTERGEVRAGADTEQIASVGPAMMSYYCLTEKAVLPDGYTERLVDNVLLPLVRP